VRCAHLVGGVTASLLALGGTASAQTVARPVPPLMLGGEAEFDACNAAGVVEGLDARGDGFLSVRAGPAIAHREIARLRNGDSVYICLSEGEWYGVVFPQGARCGVTSPWPRRRAYRGPCASGWVHRRWVGGTAG
jgi:hypothetical protein